VSQDIRQTGSTSSAFLTIIPCHQLCECIPCLYFSGLQTKCKKKYKSTAKSNKKTMANSKKHIRFKIHFNLTTKPECVRTKVTANCCNIGNGIPFRPVPIGDDLTSQSIKSIPWHLMRNIQGFNKFRTMMHLLLLKVDWFWPYRSERILPTLNVRRGIRGRLHGRFL
jgi:hypothetical protein